MQLALFCAISHNGHPHKLISCCTRNVLGFTAFFLPAPHSTPSLLPCYPQHGVQFGRFAEQCAMTVYEPNDSVEVGSSEVTTVLLLSRRASIGSPLTTLAHLQLWRRYRHYTCIIASGWKTKFGIAGFTVVDCHICDREEKMFHQFWERQFESVLFKSRLGNIPNFDVCKSRNMFFLFVKADDVKFVGKKRNIDPMWKVCKKEVDLAEPTSCT